MHWMNEAVRWDSVIGRPLTEVAILVAAREMDQAYEWNAHENTAHSISVDDKVIDIIKNDKEPTGIGAKEATIIRLGRASFREHKVSPALWARTVELFGRRGAVEITMIMGDYTMAGVLLSAVDQQLPVDAKYMLPPRPIPAPRPVQSAPVIAGGLPADVDAKSLARVPLVDRESLDEWGKQIYDMAVGPNPEAFRIGPAGVSFYNMRAAEAMHLINDYLSRRGGTIGPRNTQLAILVASRAFDQQFEWTNHETAAVRVGVPQNVIDVVKYERDLDGLSEGDAAIIRFGRQLLYEHKLDSDGWAQAVRLFGMQGALDMAALMGDYVMAAIMLNAVDQHLPAQSPPMMPARH
jgi:4-carboxymuconolactone decarboxylase